MGIIGEMQRLQVELRIVDDALARKRRERATPSRPDGPLTSKGSSEPLLSKAGTPCEPE